MLRQHENSWPIEVGDRILWVKDSIGKCSECSGDAYLAATVSGRDRLYCEMCAQIFDPDEVEAEVRCGECGQGMCCRAEMMFECPICHGWAETDEEAVAHCSDGLRTMV